MHGLGMRPVHGLGTRLVRGLGTRPGHDLGTRLGQGLGTRPVHGLGTRPVRGLGTRPVRGLGTRLDVSILQVQKPGGWASKHYCYGRLLPEPPDPIPPSLPMLASPLQAAKCSAVLPLESANVTSAPRLISSSTEGTIRQVKGLQWNTS